MASHPCARQSGGRIEASAPTRVDLAGGTLDIWPLYLFHENAVTLNCAVTLAARCEIEPHLRESRIQLVSRDTQRRETFASLENLGRAKKFKLPLAALLIRQFAPRGGFTLTTDSQAPSGAGIGGSSALAVAICAALDCLTGAGLSRMHWIHISRDVEAMVLGIPTGTQDHYAAAYGGAAALELAPGCIRRHALRMDPADLERRMVVCYTGAPRHHGINNWHVFRAQTEGNARVRRNLGEIAAIARAMREALEEADWREAARLMREEWNFRRRNLPGISSAAIDRVLGAARSAGALAGKVCGAGGGGCVALLIEPESRERVNGAIVQAGGRVLPVRIDRRGVQVRSH
jgi:D-glycero-alpha-D-manno-heptose-7-phosphate kinase